ncbi:TPA: hypothetical protein RVS66_000404 [Pasteurella multocida]|nr:hypothetical protein [Pasteurella multocida]HED4454460.1 hypothetical protein [Pasteurella multocida]
MAQKLLKHELVERLLQLQEQQAKLAVQVEHLTQEINELVRPFTPKEPKVKPVITTPLVAKVLRDSGWIMCSEIAEIILRLQGRSECVEVDDQYYRRVKRILWRMSKKGIVECGGVCWRLKPID